jgi:hypothetical protein
MIVAWHRFLQKCLNRASGLLDPPSSIVLLCCSRLSHNYTVGCFLPSLPAAIAAFDATDLSEGPCVHTKKRKKDISLAFLLVAAAAAVSTSFLWPLSRKLLKGKAATLGRDVWSEKRLTWREEEKRELLVQNSKEQYPAAPKRKGLMH